MGNHRARPGDPILAEGIRLSTATYVCPDCRTRVDHFAYPTGRFDSRVVKAVAASGYRFGYTTCPHRDRTRPRLTIPRRVFWQNTCLDAFGRFSSTMMDCQVKGTFDFGARCRGEHVRATRVMTAAPECVGVKV